MIVPALVNWKIGHYGALVKEDGDRYLLQDSTFAPNDGRQIWVSQKALDEEASGYFLVADGSLPEGWQTVSQQEGARVWVVARQPGTGPCYSSCCPANGG